MKIFITGLAAILVSASAFAQSASPADPMAPPAPMATPAPMTDPAAPITGPMAPSAADPAAAPLLTEKNGRWWNGDRRATNTEIADYKRSRPQ